MLVSLSIENFKNFKDEQSLLLHDSCEDSFAFTILVGNNGSGKSSVLDAIEWVVFNRSAGALRASRKDDLISTGKNFLSVEALFVSSCDKLSLRITRTHQRGGLTRSVAVLSRCTSGTERIVQTLNSADEIIHSLRDTFCIDVSNLERMVIKQQNASSIACSKPKLMLDYLEVCVGTDRLKASSYDNFLHSSRLSAEQNTILAIRESILLEIDSLQPSVDTAQKLRAEERTLNCCLSRLHTAERHLLERSQYETLEKLKITIIGRNNVAERVRDLATTVRCLSKQLIASKSCGYKVKLLKEQCDKYLLESGDKISMLLQIQKDSEKIKAMRIQKVKELSKLISTGEAKLLRLRESLEEASKRLSEQQTEAITFSVDLHRLLKTSNPNNKNVLFEGDLSQNFLDERLDNIRFSINELKELGKVDGDLTELAQGFAIVEMQHARCAKGIDHAKSMLLNFLNKTKENNAIQFCLEAEIAALDSERRSGEEALNQMRENVNKLSDETMQIRNMRQNQMNVSKIMKRFDEFNLIKSFINDYPALLAVFGSRLTDTLVVTTRSVATIVAQACKKLNISSITIEILDEIEKSRESPSIYRNSMRPLVANSSDSVKSLVPMMKCVKVTYPSAISLIDMKLKPWSFFDGIGHEAMHFIQSSNQGLTKIAGSTNVVARDGSRMMRDGEIRISYGTSYAVSRFSSKNSLQSWPSKIYDRLPRLEKVDSKHVTDHLNTLEMSIFQLEAEVALAAINLNKINILLDQKHAQLSGVANLRKVVLKLVLEKEFIHNAFEGGIAFENIEDLEVHLNKIDMNLAADLKKAAYDKVNHRKAVEDLKRSKDALQRRLISLLGIDDTEDGHRLQGEFIQKSAAHEGNILGIISLESQIRMIASAIDVLHQNIVSQTEKLINLKRGGSSDTDFKSKLPRRNGPQKSGKCLSDLEEQMHSLEIIRLQDLIGMTNEDRDGRKQQLSCADDITRNLDATIILAKDDLNRMKIREINIIRQLKVVETKLSTIAEMTVLKRTQISVVEEKLCHAPVDLPSITARSGELRSRKYATNAINTSCEEFVENAAKVSDELIKHKKVKLSFIPYTTQKEQPALRERESYDRDFNVDSNFIPKTGESAKEDNSSNLRRRGSFKGTEQYIEEHLKCKESAKEEGMIDMTQLDLIAGQLSLRSKSIDIRASKMNIEAIFAQYIDLVQRFECASTTARSLNSQACEKQRSGIELQEQRYYLLTQHLQRINVRLSETYKSIVPEADCYLSYAANPISLFEEGIKLLAQHNHSAWREAGNLSGGQQALCSLSLLLAIQDCFPSPLYIMDEVDASLDTLTVARIGVLLREKCRRSKVQFLMVSHRPEMQEYASRIVGFYVCSNIPQVFSAGFDIDGTKAETERKLRALEYELEK